MSRKIVITTLTTAAIAQQGGDDVTACEVGLKCEGVHTLADQPDYYYVITSDVTDPAELAAFRGYIGPGERLGRVRRPIIDEVPR